MTPRRIQTMGAYGAKGLLFHCVSRKVERDFVFGQQEREAFARMLRKVEAFCGVQVITWTMLSNHFHVVVFVPEASETVSEQTFWSRLTALYGRDGVTRLQKEWDQIRERHPGAHGESMVAAERQRFLNRMHDLSAFMSTLKQRFSLWFNAKHKRIGTLWEGRFKSILIEGTWATVATVAAYVDLNAVRAGLVRDPKDYRWCGYAEAVAGRADARCGLIRLLAQDREVATTDWRQVSREYRLLLFGAGEATGIAENRAPSRKGLSRTAVEEVARVGGRLRLPELLRCRVRHFTDGLALGSAEFVEQVFEQHRELFTKGRQRGARPLRGGNFGKLRSLRDLQRRPVMK